MKEEVWGLLVSWLGSWAFTVVAWVQFLVGELRSHKSHGLGEKGGIFSSVVKYTWASQVVLVVKNPPANTGDTRHAD